jgi:hypothetical protein
MANFHQCNVFATSRGEGPHPKLRVLLERAAASPFSEVSICHDGPIQARPSSDSEIVSTWVNAAFFSRPLAHPIFEAPKPSTGSSTRDQIV